MHLSLDGLSLSFAHQQQTMPVLDDVCLEVGSGGFVSVLGPSGCGKSTLLNVLTGLTKPDAGVIQLNGAVVADVRAASGYMQQKDLLLPWRKALANAMLGAQLLGRNVALLETQARQLFEAFDLQGFESHYPSQLSGGMRQRVALVRTLLIQRPLLLLDEPFGALDALTRQRLHRWILKAWQEFDKTILMVTHDVDEALLLADRIVVLTPRPAQVQTVFEVNLPRPRDRMGLPFAELRQALWRQASGVLGGDG